MRMSACALRVRAQQENRTAILKEAEIFGGRVVDSSTEGFALEVTGEGEKLDEFIKDNLLGIDKERITVSQEGMLVVRNIAMAFDPLLEVKQGMYSKTI